MYTIDGASEIPEFTLDHLAGYGDSRPVRIGNGAAKQLQLDVFGELMEAVSVLHKAGVSVPLELWEHLRRMLNWLADYWREPDEGIWEVRGARHQFTFSRLMSWVAFDRGIQVGKDLGVSGEFDLWHRIRGEISDALMVEGWSESRASFVQYPGALALDASLLLIPILGYLGSDAPRVLQMLDTTMKSRERGGLACNGRVYRYDTAQTDDGLAGDEGTFNVCTFWLVEALAMGARFRPEWLSDSQALFERMLLTANHLGLFPEQSGKQGEPLGNFPQAFTHLGLITAALALDKALDAASVPSQ
jgi:GH15 family glucan-1,4-alpha-glucosidase